MLSWLRKLLVKKYKLSTGDLVKDIGDTFHAVSDPGIVIEVYEDRYTYRHPLFFGLLRVKIDGIVVRWLDKKGTSHVYPSCCVRKLEISEEKAQQLKVEIEERFNKPKEPLPPVTKTTEQLDIPFDWEDFEKGEDTEETDPIPEVPPEKPALNKMQEKLREVQKIVEERNKNKEEVTEE